MKIEHWDGLIERGLSGYVILLDVDGTLLPDGETEVSEEIKNYLGVLKKDNEIYLLSNSRVKGRIDRVSFELDIPHLDTRYKKPNSLIQKALPKNGKSVLVIGDKIMIDGTLAMMIGAKLVIVERQVSAKDRWFVKVGYFCEDLVFSFLKFFIRG